MRLDPNIVRQQIANLKLLCPEAWEEGDEQLLTDMLAAETELNEFLAILEDQRQEAAYMAGAIEERVIELETRQKRLMDREVARRHLMQKLLEAADMRKVELPVATLSLRAVAPSVVIECEDDLPDIVCKFKRLPDKTKIKELLGTGIVAGARMSNGGTTLSIRTK